MKGSEGKSGRGVSRRSAGKRSRSVGTLEPTPLSGSSHLKISPSLQRSAHNARPARAGDRDGSSETIPSTSR